jgi:hypothetical protein
MRLDNVENCITTRLILFSAVKYVIESLKSKTNAYEILVLKPRTMEFGESEPLFYIQKMPVNLFGATVLT